MRWEVARGRELLARESLVPISKLLGTGRRIAHANDLVSRFLGKLNLDIAQHLSPRN